MDLTRPLLTRWTAELVDREQERRFRRYNLALQRRTAVVALVAILAANLFTFGYSLIGGHSPVYAWRVGVQAGAVAIGCAIVVALRKPRPARSMFHAVVCSVVLLTVLVAALIATGSAMGFRGALLVAGGVILIYLAAPLTVVNAVALSVLYSAVTIPVWLLLTTASADADVTYTLMATGFAHVMGFLEARRAQQERRVLFAHREALQRLSAVDPLTGLANRRAFIADLDRAWELWRAAGSPMSLVMLDLDHFKVLNDGMGHAAGDRALQVAACAIRDCLPGHPGELAVRYGGEEFVCVLPGLEPASATVVAERMLAALRAAAIAAGGGPCAALTMSAGAAGARPEMAGAQDLVDAADRALYRAKADGRDCVRAAASVPPGPADSVGEVRVLPAA